MGESNLAKPLSRIALVPPPGSALRTFVVQGAVVREEAGVTENHAPAADRALADCSVFFLDDAVGERQPATTEAPFVRHRSAP
jgi:hypothetical protein